MALISQYQVVIPGQTITAALWNGMELNIINNGLIPGGIEDYSATDVQMQTMTDPFPASAISKPTSLAGELERMRWQFDNIIGGSQWYEDPPVDITTFKTRFDAHTHDGSANNGPTIGATGITNGAIVTDKIGDAQITTPKIADSNVTTAKIADSNVTTSKIADANITLGKLAADAKFASGTVILFYQSAAPTGWTKLTSQNDKVLRVVSGTGGGSGGSHATSTAITLAHTHTVNSHTHSVPVLLLDYTILVGNNTSTGTIIGSLDTDGEYLKTATGGGGSCRVFKNSTIASTSGAASPSTNSQLSNISLAYIDVIACSKD